MKMDIILSKWCLAILFAFGILACTDGGDANELPKDLKGLEKLKMKRYQLFLGQKDMDATQPVGVVAMYILLLHWRTSCRTELYVMVLRN